MTEEAQTFNGEITIATAELNPEMLVLAFTVPTGDIAYTFYDSSIGKTANTLIDLGAVALPDNARLAVRNAGDENIDIQIIVEIDGAMINTPQVFENRPPSVLPTAIFVGALPLHALAVGEHTISWFVRARRSGTTDAFAEHYHDSTTYYCYTAAMDAIAEEVLIVQNEAELHWLAGTPEGFIASPITIEPNKETHFKFRLINPGDEPVRVQIGHKVNTHYETGILLGGVPIDTIDEYVEIEAGGTSEALTATFTLPEGKAAVSFSVWRTRHIPGALEQSFAMVLENSTGTYGNLVSSPVYDSRPISEILNPGKYPSLFAIYKFNTDTQSWVTSSWAEPFEPGVGYSIPSGEHIEEAVIGTPYTITSDALIASLQTGFNLVAVGIEPVDISATGYTATYHTPTGVKQENITILEPGKSYFIEK